MTTRRIAVMASGADAPGVNAALRAVTRAGRGRGWEVLGVCDGLRGLVEGRFVPLEEDGGATLLARGGSVLGDLGGAALVEEDACARARSELASADIDGLVVVGGGSAQTTALALARRGVTVVGVAATLENELAGVDIALGVDTALGTAIEAIDRLGGGAGARRVSVVEVAGQRCGYLALAVGVASGAAVIVVPEMPLGLDAITERARQLLHDGLAHVLVVVAQGAWPGSATLARHLEAHLDEGVPVHATTLADLQGGGAPSAFDRLLGSRLGLAAVNQLARGPHSVVLGLCKGRVMPLPLAEVVGRPRVLDAELLEVASSLGPLRPAPLLGS